MPYTITVDQPNLGEGGKVAIPGLGVFENGKDAEVSDEQAAQYELVNGQSITDAVKSMYGVSINEGGQQSLPEEQPAPQGSDQGQAKDELSVKKTEDHEQGQEGSQ